MCHGKELNYKAVNKPIIKADAMSLCRQMLEVPSFVPQGNDFISRLTELGMLGWEAKSEGEEEMSV